VCGRSTWNGFKPGDRRVRVMMMIFGQYYQFAVVACNAGSKHALYSDIALLYTQNTSLIILVLSLVYPTATRLFARLVCEVRDAVSIRKSSRTPPNVAVLTASGNLHEVLQDLSGKTSPVWISCSTLLALMWSQ
jgi:hypothetical protein